VRRSPVTWRRSHAVLASVATRHARGPSLADLQTCWIITLAAAIAITAIALSMPRTP
jgi:hypothetical protein